VTVIATRALTRDERWAPLVRGKLVGCLCSRMCELTCPATGFMIAFVLAIRVGIGDRPSFQKDNGYTRERPLGGLCPYRMGELGLKAALMESAAPDDRRCHLTKLSEDRMAGHALGVQRRFDRRT
jgi:hypothetical protein